MNEIEAILLAKKARSKAYKIYVTFIRRKTKQFVKDLELKRRYALERKQLEQMSDYELKDIGLSRSMIPAYFPKKEKNWLIHEIERDLSCLFSSK